MNICIWFLILYRRSPIVGMSIASGRGWEDPLRLLLPQTRSRSATYLVVRYCQSGITMQLDVRRRNVHEFSGQGTTVDLYNTLARELITGRHVYICR